MLFLWAVVSVPLGHALLQAHQEKENHEKHLRDTILSISTHEYSIYSHQEKKNHEKHLRECNDVNVYAWI